MSDEKYKQEARHSWQEIASIAESVPESASYIHGFIDGMKIGNKELEHKLELAKEALVRILSSEALKEAPFYTYSEVISIGREVLVRLK